VVSKKVLKGAVNQCVAEFELVVAILHNGKASVADNSL
jgi:hypothetical protein